LVLLAQLVPTAPRVRLELLDQPVLLELAVLLVTVVRMVLPDLLASLGLLVQMVSLVPRESWERVDRRVTPVPLALRDPQGPLDLWDLLVFLDLKEPVVLRELLVQLVSPVLLAELDLLAPTVTPVLLAPLVLPVKMVLRALAVTPVPQEDRETPGFAELLVPPERRESLERMDPLVPTGLQVPRVLLDLVVSLVCPVSVERGASPVSLDLLESPESRELQVLAVTVDPLGP